MQHTVKTMQNRLALQNSSLAYAFRPAFLASATHSPDYPVPPTQSIFCDTSLRQDYAVQISTSKWQFSLPAQASTNGSLALPNGRPAFLASTTRSPDYPVPPTQSRLCGTTDTLQTVQFRQTLQNSGLD